MVSRPLASSTVMTPSLPTVSMALASICPMSASPLALMVPTCAISLLSPIGLLSRRSSFTTASVARSRPRLRSIGL